MLKRNSVQKKKKKIKNNNNKEHKTTKQIISLTFPEEKKMFKFICIYYLFQCIMTSDTLKIYVRIKKNKRLI